MSRGRAPWRARVTAGMMIAAFVACAAPASAGDPATARELLKRGYLLAQDDKCEDAVALFEESVRLDPKAITLINYADCEEKLGRFGSALGHWVDARARAKVEGNSAVEAEAERRAKLLEPRLARLTMVLPPSAPEGTVVVRDGVTLGSVALGIETPVDPGRHVLVVRAPGREDAPREISLAEGEARRVELEVGAPAPVSSRPAREAPTSRGTSPLVWVGFGVGAAGLAAGAATGIVALSRANEAERTCPGGACPDRAALDRVEDGRTFGTVSTIAFAVGGAGVAFGVAMLVFGSRGSNDTRAALGVSPTGVSLTGAF